MDASSADTSPPIPNFWFSTFFGAKNSRKKRHHSRVMSDFADSGCAFDVKNLKIVAVNRTPIPLMKDLQRCIAKDTLLIGGPEDIHADMVFLLKSALPGIIASLQFCQVMILFKRDLSLLIFIRLAY